MEHLVVELSKIKLIDLEELRVGKIETDMDCFQNGIWCVAMLNRMTSHGCHCYLYDLIGNPANKRDIICCDNKVRI